MLARTLSRTLIVLALAPATLAGCGAKRSAPAADRKPEAIAAGTGSTGAPRGPAAGDQAATAMPVGAAAGTGHAIAAPPVPVEVASGEGYLDHGRNGWVETRADHVSTFAADVDTASYTIVRRKLREGTLPPPAAVRVEELVNYFRYGYPTAADPARPFAVHMDAAPSPLAPGRQVLRVGVTTRAPDVGERKKANLVFLVDVSGSMQSPDKLDLAKRALRILVDNLKDGDTVALVTYAGSTRVVLPATGLARKGEILAAIEDLSAGGSTAMASGLELAYQEALKGLAPDAESRVLVLSDGDANVGATSPDVILKTIEGHVREGVTLSTVGFGMGNYKDGAMEQLADKGNGQALYIDGLDEARRVFQDQVGATLEVVAQDVKLQVDFDARAVARYRLLGYENRDVRDQDFRDDRVDAGEIGAGHQVTALYELELTPGAPADLPLAAVRVRHKAPRGVKAEEARFDFDPDRRATRFAAASADLRFAFAVAGFADVLRGGPDAPAGQLAELERIARAAAGDDPARQELVTLIGRARALRGEAQAALAD